MKNFKGIKKIDSHKFNSKVSLEDLYNTFGIIVRQGEGANQIEYFGNE